MACCFEELGDYAVTPMLVAPCSPEKCCDGPPLCYPCLPRCPKGQVVYYCEKPQCKATKSPDDCCQEIPKATAPKRQPSCPSEEYCCPTCNNPCKPIKTKYVIPCYRYEDGRIEQYVPTRHGRLPISAYRRNGIQDQIEGYRGAMRYLCAGGRGGDCCVYTAVEPIRKIYPRITQEMLPVRRKKEKKVRQLPVSAFKRNGMQDQEHSKLLGTTNFLKRCPRDVSIECEVSPVPVKVKDPIKVPRYENPLNCCILKKTPIEVALEDVLDD